MWDVWQGKQTPWIKLNAFLYLNSLVKLCVAALTSTIKATAHVQLYPVEQWSGRKSEMTLFQSIDWITRSTKKWFIASKLIRFCNIGSFEHPELSILNFVFNHCALDLWIMDVFQILPVRKWYHNCVVVAQPFHSSAYFLFSIQLFSYLLPAF